MDFETAIVKSPRNPRSAMKDSPPGRVGICAQTEGKHGEVAHDSGKSLNFRVQALASSLFKGAQQFYGAWVGLSVPELRIISSLESDAPATATDLVTLTAMDKALVSRVLAALDRRGLIGVTASLQRRRKTWVLTSSGKQLVCRMRPVWRRREALVEEQLSKVQRGQIKHLLDLLFESSEALRLMEADPANVRQILKPGRQSKATSLMRTHLRWIRSVRQDAGGVPGQ